MNKFELLIVIIATFSLITSLSAIYISFSNWRYLREKTKEEKRLEFLQRLNSQILPHNWKFVEYFDENKGVRPGLDTTKTVEQNKEALGSRVVLLDHLNLLWQVYSHKHLLRESDVDGYKNWARSWYPSSKENLKIVFEDGDLYPLDFITWLKKSVFISQFSDDCIGEKLSTRLESWNETK